MFKEEIFPGITRIAERYKGILLDAYGVFWNGNECGLLPNTKESMEKLMERGRIVGILTNSTQLASNEIRKLHAHGLIQGKHYHFLITSGEVARDIFFKQHLPFVTPNKKFWLFGGAHPRYATHEGIFKDTLYKETADLEDADFIYISIPHLNGEDQTNPELFRTAIEKIKIKNLPMICPNPDCFAHEGKPSRKVVRQGSIAKMYEEMGGEVFYIGKPQPKPFAMAMGYFEKYGSFSLNDILMVGDTPETDIRGAKLFGMSAALVTKTGIVAEKIAEEGWTLDTLNLSDRPDYFIERLIDDF